MQPKINLATYPALKFIGVEPDKYLKTLANPWRFKSDPQNGKIMKEWYLSHIEDIKSMVIYFSEETKEELSILNASHICDLLERYVNLFSKQNPTTTGTFLHGDKNEVVMFSAQLCPPLKEKGEDKPSFLVNLLRVTPIKGRFCSVSSGVLYVRDEYNEWQMYPTTSDFDSHKLGDGSSEHYDKAKESLESDMIIISNMALCFFLSVVTKGLDAYNIPSGCKVLEDDSEPPIMNYSGRNIIYVNSLSQGKPTLRMFTESIEKLEKENQDNPLNLLDHNPMKTTKPTQEPTDILDIFDQEYENPLEYINSGYVDITEGSSEHCIFTSKCEFSNANILECEIGDNGHHGGDSGHGGRLYFRLQDGASTDMRVGIINSDPNDVTTLSNGRRLTQCSGVDIILGGDAEQDTFHDALWFAANSTKLNHISESKILKYDTTIIPKSCCPVEVSEDMYSGKELELQRRYNDGIAEIYNKEVSDNLSMLRLSFSELSPSSKNYSVLHKYYSSGMKVPVTFIGVRNDIFRECPHSKLCQAKVYAIAYESGLIVFASDSKYALLQYI